MNFEVWLTLKLYLTFKLWFTFELWLTFELWFTFDYGWGDRQTDTNRQTHRHINTVTRPGLTAGPSENKSHTGDHSTSQHVNIQRCNNNIIPPIKTE